MIEKCECGSGMFVETVISRSTYRRDYVGNISGGDKDCLSIRTVRRVCEKCGKNQPLDKP